MNTVLQTKGLCKTYIVNKRQNNVLKNIDLTIHEGEIVAIMGPSGSGKSTLLYCVSGMDRVTAGRSLNAVTRSLHDSAWMKWDLSFSRCT